jgi:carboxyl-terminal processing protease
MSPRSLHLPRRLALLLTALFLTLSLSVRGDDLQQAPATTSPAAPVAAPDPGKVLPATGGPAEQDETKPAPKSDVVTPDSAVKDDPAPGTEAIKLPEVKPITVNSERDAEIGHVVGQLLEQNHYLQKPISPEMSQRWLKNYFLALDPTHLFLLQTDIDEFTAKYGDNLGTLLLHNDNDAAAVAPAFEIFNRYMQRVNEDVTLADKLVTTKFDFTKDETYTIRTNKSTWIPDATAAAAIWRSQVKSDLLNGVLNKKSSPAEATRIAKRYVSLLREGSEEDDMDVIETYLSALTHAYDPHSDYFQPDEAQNFNIQAIDHAVTGIGAVLKSEDGYATIDKVIVGGPADLDKRLKAGDKVLAVGQGTAEPVYAVNMKLNRVVDMIRGEKGSMVHLVISPAGAAEGTLKKDIVIKRDIVSIKDSLAKAHIIEHKLPGGGTEKLGVIDLHDFYKNTASDVAKLVQRLKKENVDGIILDLRSNGGGLLDQAVNLTGLFVKHEPVVQIRRSDGYIDQLGPEDTRQIYDGPLVVMVNRMSASATEIVAAALQDYNRAIIVGDTSTHGKGTVQTLIPLEPEMQIGFPSSPGPGNLKMTVQKFYRVAGGSTQKMGVIPDIILPSVLDAFELGETTLPYYLPYDTVPAVTFNNYDLVAPYVSTLRANSIARVNASPDFGYVREDIAYNKKRVQDPTVSLNEATRLKEQEDLKKLNASRKKDLLARKGTRDTELDLTLDMVENNLPAAAPEVKKPETASDDADGDAADADLDSALNNPTYDPQLGEAVDIMSDYTRMLHDSGSKLVQTAPGATK